MRAAIRISPKNRELRHGGGNTRVNPLGDFHSFGTRREASQYPNIPTRVKPGVSMVPSRYVLRPTFVFRPNPSVSDPISSPNKEPSPSPRPSVVSSRSSNPRPAPDPNPTPHPDPGSDPSRPTKPIVRPTLGPPVLGPLGPRIPCGPSLAIRWAQGGFFGPGRRRFGRRLAWACGLPSAGSWAPATLLG